MIDGSQLRAARALLGWSVVKLSQNTGIGTTTLKRYESSVGLSNALPHYVEHLISVFEKEGIIFVSNSFQGVGIFIKNKN